uniref:Uncharacterized protein n=1 Tax=viral metagenome TaxID=1070528 RepID=A0A6M3JMA0_9ZZZZ
MNREAIARIIEGIMCPDWYPEEVRVEASQRVVDQILALQPELKALSDIQEYIDKNNIYRVEQGHYEEQQWIPLKTHKVNLPEIF